VRNCISFYLPVSLLTSFSKVFVKIVYSQLLRHLYDCNILAEEQIQFKKSNNWRSRLWIK